ncbi:hypothetical protein [Chryseobacterium wanjuense]
MKKSQYLLFSFLLLFVISCGSTQIVNSWRDPDKHIHPGDWKKVLVVALLKNETNRRKAEDEMVKYLNGKGIPSYQYLDGKFNQNDEEALRNKMKKDGFDAAITVRLVDVDREKIFIPEQHYMYPLYYDDFSKYYFRNRLFFNTPGYYTVTKKFIIETVIYSIQDDKII